MITGETLYDLYTLAMSEQNVEVDGWDDISEVDRNAWNRLAEQVQFREGT